MDNESSNEGQAERLVASRLRYATFLAANPGTQLVEISGDRAGLFLVNPWDDSSFALSIPTEDEEFHSALEHLVLPPRYSAIYHSDMRKLEVIWTAYKLDETQSEIFGRSFSFVLSGIERNCSFSVSSDRLLVIARQVVPLSIPSAEFRNLRSFSAYVENKDNIAEGELSPFGETVSFWIDNVDWNDADIANLVRHINFYLRYYDALSPTIAIHSALGNTVTPRNRYLLPDKFPRHITSQNLDANLLLFWAGSIDQHPSTAFLNYYRIIEYVSYNYPHDVARQQLLDIIRQPHVLSDPQGTSTRLLLVLRELKLQREQDAILTLVKEVVRPCLLWSEIIGNRAAFETTITFDGGLIIEPLISQKDTQDSFGHSHVERFARTITLIRNALAHGRDTKSGNTILPLVRNFYALQPWLHLIATAAGEVVLSDAAH